MRLHHALVHFLGASIYGLAVGASWSTPEPMRVQDGVAPYDNGLFTPLESLDALSSTDFTTLAHPAFPHHSVRVKESHFCDGTVKAYTGYIDVEARHLFFYFFESRRDPILDDVVFWTNGGPGGSSSMGLFTELGPCTIFDANSTVWNPYSWINQASIVFVDQPVGVGFSYADHGESVATTMEAAKDIAAFMAIFFSHFTQFQGRPFHAAGESYGGRYIPVFASAIYDQNAQLVEAGITPINLSSIIIGNGCSDWPTMFTAYYEALCSDPALPPVLDTAKCIHLKQLLPRCLKRYQESCVDNLDVIDCREAAKFCSDPYYKGIFSDQLLNPYDRSRPCNGESIDKCFPDIARVVGYLSNSSIQAALGVDPAVRGNFSFSSASVARAFDATLDWYNFPATDYIAALLERGVRALIFAGEDDWICNWIGNEKMTMGLEWSRQEEFRREELKSWNVGSTFAGMTRSGGGLTFATINGADHFTPSKRPVESLTMFNTWLAGEEL